MTKFESGYNYKVECEGLYKLVFKCVDRNTQEYHCAGGIYKKTYCRFVLVNIDMNCDLAKNPVAFEVLKEYFDFIAFNSIEVKYDSLHEYERISHSYLQIESINEVK